MMRYVLALFLLLCLNPATVMAADDIPPPDVTEIPAFVFQGDKCPVGSYPYRGPEAKMLEKENPGLIYCRLMSKVRPMLKTETRKTCPRGMPEYTQEGIKPDPNYIWCPRGTEVMGGMGMPPGMPAPSKGTPVTP